MQLAITLVLADTVFLLESNVLVLDYAYTRKCRLLETSLQKGFPKV